MVANIFSLHIMQSSVLLLHSSQATKWQQGRNNVCTRVCFHFRQVISERYRPFSLSALLCLQHTHPQQYVLCNAFAFQHYSMPSSQTQRRNDDRYAQVSINFLTPNQRIYNRDVTPSMTLSMTAFQYTPKVLHFVMLSMTLSP